MVDDGVERLRGDHQHLAIDHRTRVIDTGRIHDQPDLAEPLPGLQHTEHGLAAVGRRDAEAHPPTLHAEQRLRRRAICEQHFVLRQAPAHDSGAQRRLQFGRQQFRTRIAAGLR
ncbi:hypothetical protein Tamer19_05290 [Cupriavidus sp. TA19]|nr:hypothetical protein Tamer19_05290 [Cupriavidus sp. TA19]